MAKIRRIVGTLKPRARQVLAEHGHVKPNDVLNTGDFDTTSSTPGWLAILNDALPDEADNASAYFVYCARRPFHPERLWSLLS